MKNFILCYVCAFALLICSSIQQINAQNVWDGTADVSWFDASQTDFYIYTAEELAGLASIVNNSTSNFSGKTIHLEADIWLNADDDNTNNWIKIGGCTQSTGEITGTIKAFCGTFHGGGHIIYNMYCDNSGYFQAGLFGNLQYPGSIDSLILINPVAKANGMMGALVGFIGNNTNSGNGTVNISECMVINEQVIGVNTSSNNNTGGLVGAAYPNKQSGGYCNTNIDHCIVTGSITGQYVGGICGNSQGAVCSNCYFAGTITSSYATGGICGYSGSVNNCFSSFSGSNSSGNGITKTLTYMLSTDFLGDLDNHFKQDFCDFNDGFPVLTWLPCENDPDCGIVSGITITDITGTSAMISWSASPYGTPVDYILEYTVAGEEAWDGAYAESNSYLLSGLEPNTSYQIRIMTNCEEGSSDWQTSNFSTHCLVSEDFSIGQGTNTTYYYPADNYFKYSYSQQIFTAEELGSTANSISGISFQYGHTSPSTKKNDVNIYLGHTTKNAFASGSDFEGFDSLQLVYSGPLNCTQGWNRFDFDNTFEYNGIDNLIVAVDDNSGDYNGSSYVFNTHSTSGYLAIAYHSDSNNPDPTNPSSLSGTYYNTRNNVKIHYCSNGTCAAPVIMVTNTTPNSADLEWTPGYQESTWELRYKANGDVDWTEEGYVYETTYQLFSLSPNTHYTVQLRAICDDGSESSWTSANFKTECGPITSSDLPWFTNFDEEDYSGLPDNQKFPDCWSKLTSDPSHFPYVYTGSYHSAPASLDFHYTPNCYDVAILPGIGDDVDANSLMLSFYLIQSSTSVTMEIGVMDDKDDITTFEVLDTLNASAINTWEYVIYPLSNYTGYGKYIAFRVSNGTSNTFRIDDLTLDYTPTCMQPLNVIVSNINADNATIAWTDVNGASSWIIEYDTTGFTPGLGNTTPATSNPFELTGLNSSYTYDIYVSAFCGGSDYSDYSQVCTFTTQICNTSDQCQYTLNLHDSYGDGWNGNYITIYSDNILVGTYTVASGNYEASFNVGLCDMSNTRFEWHTGSYSGETSFEILDPAEDIIYSCSDGSTLSSGATFTNFTVTCSAQICLKPTNLTATNITTTSADLSWTARNGETSWNIEYGPAGFTPGTGTMLTDIMDNPYELTGLTPTTSYDVYVQSNCDADGTSSWSAKCNFTTECAVYELPFTENFTTSSMPACWNRYSGIFGTETPTATTSGWIFSSTYAFGHVHPKVNIYGTTCNYWLVSPAIDLTTAETPVLSFNLALTAFASSSAPSSTSDDDKFIVAISTDNGATWSTDNAVIWNDGDPTADHSYAAISHTGEAIHIDLSDYIGHEIKIAFYGESTVSGGDNDLHIDSVMVYDGEIPATCDVPTNLASNNVLYNSANITWNAGNANKWNLQYRAQSGNWIAVNNLTSASHQLTGLSAQTAYEVQVQAVCTDNESDWTASHTFTTPAAPVNPCDAPTDLQIGNINETSAVASWNANGGTNWRVGYKQQNVSQWQEATTATSSFNLEGLTANTSYDFRVKTICADNESDFVSTSFTTQPEVGIDNVTLFNSISLMPNPADNYITLTINANVTVEEAVVYNAFGQLIQTVPLSNNQSVINLDNYASGIYFVRISGDNTTATKKFIKK